MIIFILSILWFLLVTLFLIKLANVFLGRTHIPSAQNPEFKNAPFISIVVPVRNEENNIERCLHSLLHQTYPKDCYCVIVADDHSTDRTPGIISELCRKYSHLKSVRIQRLPEGWTGKNNACRRGAEIAEGKWICFIDADTEAQPDLIRSVIEFANDHQVDVLSLSPFQKIVSWEERLFLPAIFITIASTLNLNRINRPEYPDAIANGQFILFKKKVYDALGGHSIVKRQIMEDIAFANIIKQKGYRLFFGFGDALIATRMYQNTRQIWDGFSKNLTTLIKAVGLLDIFIAALKSIVVGWGVIMLPVLGIVNMTTANIYFYDYLSLGFSLFAAIGFVFTYFMTLRELKISPLYVFGMPIGYTFLAALIINSAIKDRKGKKVWKGRSYS